MISQYDDRQINQRYELNEYLLLQQSDKKVHTESIDLDDDHLSSTTESSNSSLGDFNQLLSSQPQSQSILLELPQQDNHESLLQKYIEETLQKYRKQQQQLDLQIWEEQIDHCYKSQKGLTKEQYKLISNQVVGKTKQQCAICCNDFEKGERIKKLPCGHIFHTNCVKPWFQKKHNCPNCRFDLKQHFNQVLAEKSSKKCSHASSEDNSNKTETE